MSVFASLMLLFQTRFYYVISLISWQHNYYTLSYKASCKAEDNSFSTLNINYFERRSRSPNLATSVSNAFVESKKEKSASEEYFQLLKEIGRALKWVTVGNRLIEVGSRLQSMAVCLFRIYEYTYSSVPQGTILCQLLFIIYIIALFFQVNME